MDQRTTIAVRAPEQLILKTEALDSVAESIGGKQVFMDNCRLVPDEGTLRMVATWDHLSPQEQSAVSLQQLAQEEGINPVKLVGWMASAMYAYNTSIAKMINAVKQPEVMANSVASAAIIGPEGFKDREMQFKISGLLKEASGPLVNINMGHGGLESQEEFLKDAIDV